MESRELNGADDGNGPARPGDVDMGPPDPVAELLASLELDGLAVLEAAWLEDLVDFQLRLEEGLTLVFRDCLQVSFHRTPGTRPPLAIGSHWTDEPSPILLSLGPEIRFLYKHLVFELGDGLLRIVCREIEATYEQWQPDPT